MIDISKIKWFKNMQKEVNQETFLSKYFWIKKNKKNKTQNKKWPRRPLLFILWVVIVLVQVDDVGIEVDVVEPVVLIVDDVVVDVVDVGMIVNVCLWKPCDCEMFVQEHCANKVILKEYSTTVFDTNITTHVANIRAAPVVRTIIL